MNVSKWIQVQKLGLALIFYRFELKWWNDVGKYYSIFNEPPVKTTNMIKQKKLKKISFGSYSSGNNKDFLSDKELKNIIKKYSEKNH